MRFSGPLLRAVGALEAVALALRNSAGDPCDACFNTLELIEEGNDDVNQSGFPFLRCRFNGEVVSERAGELFPVDGFITVVQGEGFSWLSGECAGEIQLVSTYYCFRVTHGGHTSHVALSHKAI